MVMIVMLVVKMVRFFSPRGLYTVDSDVGASDDAIAALRQRAAPTTFCIGGRSKAAAVASGRIM